MDIPCDPGLVELERDVCQRRTALLAFDAASKDGDQIHLQEALAEALVVTHDISHDLNRLDEAISLYERILDVDSAEIVHRVRALTGLGHALWRLCEFHDEDAVRLRRAIGLLREALNLCPIGHPAQAETLYALGLALHTCFEQLSDPDSLSEAIGVLRNALRMCPLGHPLRDDSLNGLANALFTRFEHQGGTDVLTEVISLHRQALQLRLPGHPRRVKSLNNLAIALHTKFEQHGGRDTLADVIALHREVLELRPIGNPLRAQTLNNLAAALRTDFEEHGGVDALTEATALCREALNMRLPGHPLRDNSLNTLATILFMSFERQGDEDALSEAIVLFREALTMRPPPHVLRSTSLDGLARALQASFELWDFPETLQEAITLHHEALRLRPVPHPLRDETQHHFAVALETSYSISPSPDILTEAVALYREALCVRVDAHPYRYLSLMGLASALSQLAAESNEPLSWREVVSLYEEALTLCPRGHPLRPQINSRLGRCLLIPTSPIFDFDLGVERLLEGLADGYAPVKERLQDASKDLRAVEKAYNTALNEADTPEQTRRRRNVLELYQQAIQLLPRMANFGMGHLARYRTLMGSDEISRNAATRALLLGRVSQAVEMLEEGRGLFWSQALRLRTSGLDNVPEADRVELQRLFDSLDDGAHSVTLASLERPPEKREQELESQRQLSVQAEALIARVRTYAGLERFLMPAAFDTLLQTLPNGFVVIVNASSLGCHAVLLSRDGALAESLEVQLPRGLTLDSATIRASLPREADYTAQGTLRDSRAMRLSKVVPQEFEDLLLTLWTAVVSPIVRKLGLQRAACRARPRVWWCVTGDLGFMPLHAAGNYRARLKESAADYFVSSYVPTLSALTKAHANWQPVNRADLTGLLISEASSGSFHLPNVAEEIRCVSECFARSSVQILNELSEHTTVVQMQSLLERYAPQTRILHLASHGFQETNPLDSAFLLQDGRLTIADIMRLELPRAVFAFLSACQTAKGDRDAPDQAVHLAASMLFCGFRSVVGTMWLMHDEDGPQVARHFYDCLLETERLDLDDISYALDAALGMLRDTGVPASRWAPFVHMGG